MQGKAMEGGANPVPPPPPSTTQLPHVPSAAQVGRMKFVWRAFLISNFALGAYMFAMPKSKPVREDSNKDAEVRPTPVEPTIPVQEEPTFLPPTPEPVKVREPIPEDQQRELFKWMLEEIRKVKPQDRKEKQHIDEEKAILKQFIRKESIPSI